MAEEFGLKRVLGLGDLVAIEIGTTVGAGVFSLTALAVVYTGPSAPLAFAVAAIPIVFIMMAVGMMGSVMPTVGGTYRYPSRLFSPLWAWTGVWCYAIAMVFGALPMYATECVHYMQALWPGLPLKTTAILILTAFYLVNVFGISIAASVQAGMVVVLLIALVFFGVKGVPQADITNFAPLFTGGGGGFVLAACILTFALQGANSVIELGAEIKQPGRNIPRSLLISIPVVAVIYILVSIAAVGNIDLQMWTDYGKQANLSQPANEFLSRPGFMFFMVGGALFAFTTTLNGTFMWATKSLLVVSRDGLLPTSLSKTSRWGTPALFLTVLWAFSVLAVLIGAGIEIFASYATIGGMIIFIPSMVAAMRMPKAVPELYEREGFRLKGWLLYFAPIVGIVTSIIMMLILLVDLGQWAFPLLIWLIIGVAFYGYRKRVIEDREGRPFSEHVKEDLERMRREAMETSVDPE